MINQGIMTDSDTEKELKKWQQARATAVDEDKLKQKKCYLKYQQVLLWFLDYRSTLLGQDFLVVSNLLLPPVCFQPKLYLPNMYKH